jgi:membrane-bound lytic murein transglycosylase D
VLQPIDNQPYFAAISTAKQMDVKMFAELADISMEEFTALNPAHNRPVILQDHNDLILLPIDKVETFLTNLEKNDKPLVSWQSYQPKKGERLDQLAPRFGLSLATLKSVNSLSARGDISSGQTLLVPLNGETSDAELAAFNMHLLPSHDTQRTLQHTVRKGETLRSVARHYRVNVANLQAWNHQVKTIKAGQTLTIIKTAKHGHAHHYAQHQRKSRHYSQHGNKKLARS